MLIFVPEHVGHRHTRSISASRIGCHSKAPLPLHVPHDINRNPSHKLHFLPVRFLFVFTSCFPTTLNAAELPTRRNVAEAMVPKNERRTCLAAF